VTANSDRGPARFGAPDAVRWETQQEGAGGGVGEVVMPVMPDADSSRVAAARGRARRRLRRQRDLLRPVGWAVIAAVAASVASNHPAPGVAGAGAGVTAGLVIFAAATAIATRDGFIDYRLGVQLVVLAAMGGAGIILAALQPRGATDLAAGAAVWLAVTRLPLAFGIGLGAVITLGQDVAMALTGDGFSAVLAATLLSVLLGVVAVFIRQSRDSQDRTEVLLAHLEDARDEQAEAAVVAERARVAGELHDVLAHSLSAAAIQLQAARLLAERDGERGRLRASIDRTIDLVNDGLVNARQAVGALRGEDAPGVAQLDALVDSARRDLNVHATLSVEGTARPLPAQVSLALYRGAEEALTNVARYAPGAAATVVLRYQPGGTTLTIHNGPSPTAEPLAPPAVIGGGHGLAGLQERLHHVDGTVHAGPVGAGWRVELSAPT
jgi:signal transduction histidine kinase